MRIPRKRILGALTLAVAVSVAGIASAGQNTVGPVTQSLEGNVLPKKLPGKEGNRKPAALTIGVDVRVTGGQKPPPADTVVIKMDDEIAFTTKKLKQCSREDLEASATTDDAIQACKKAKVGQGSAVANCGNNTTIPAEVTAFNGNPAGKKPVIFLFTDADPGGGSHVVQTLTGTLTEKGRGDMGSKLKVEVPPLAGGACSIEEFETTVERKYTYKKKGKKKTAHYVKSSCSDSDQAIDFRGVFNYNPDPAVNPYGVNKIAVTDSAKCKPKG